MLAMLVDDSRSSLLHLQRLLGTDADVESRAFEDPDLAIETASLHRFDLVIVDHIMPKMDGITFTRRLRAMPHYAQVPIVMLTGTSSQAVRLQALEAGATDFLPKTSNWMELSVKLRNLIALSRALRQRVDHATALVDQVEVATRALQASREEMIFRLSLAVEYRDNDTGEHTLRVARYSRMIAEELGIPAGECRDIYLAAPLHDVGKVAIPDQVLLKPGRLTVEETTVMRAHAEVGERILGDSNSDLMRLAAEIAGNHHERWDGTGYPRKIAGEEIPLCARIVAVADVFDALMTERPYKAAMASSAALDCIEAERGKHFDPRCVDAFLAAYLRLHPLARDGDPAEAGAAGDGSSRVLPFPRAANG